MKKLSEIIKYTHDIGTGCRVYPARLDFYHKLGLTDNQIHKWCERFEYDPYIEHILTCKSDEELFEKYPETWKFVRDTLSTRHGRRSGRTCFATAKDLLMDGLITDIIFDGIKKLCPDLKIKKSEQDSKLSLIPHATTEPDFMVNGFYLEMKITNDKVDKKGRKKWAATFTVRSEFNEVERELLRYSEYNTSSHPLLFLRINPEDNYVAVIGYDKFKPSPYDDTYFANYRPRQFKNNINDLIRIIGEEIQKEIKEIKTLKS